MDDLPNAQFLHQLLFTFKWQPLATKDFTYVSTNYGKTRYRVDYLEIRNQFEA